MKRFKLSFLIVVATTISSVLSAQNIQQGVRALDNEKYILSKSIFTGLINVSPNDPELLYRRGMAYYMAGAKDSAKADFDKGASMSATQQAKAAFCFVGQGMLLHDAKSFAEAKALFTKAISFTDQKDARIYRAIAWVYINAETKDIPEAMNMLAKALLLDKKSADNQILMGDAKMTEIGGAGKAVSYYEAAMELDPKNPIPPYKIGDIYFAARNYEESLAAFQKALNMDSTFVPQYRELGELYHAMKRTDDAKKTYAKYMELAEPNLNTMTRYAQFLFLTKDYKGAGSLIDQIMQSDNSNPVLYRLLGYSSYENGAYPKAVEALQQFFSKETKKVITSDYEYMGKAYSKTNQDSLAVINLNKAIQSDTTRGDLHTDIADILYKSKKYADAASEYQLKIDSKGGKAADYFQMGQALFKAKKYVTADSAFTRLIELNSKTHLGYLWRGRANSQIDSTMQGGGAKPFYEKVVEMISADSAMVIKYKKDLAEAYDYLGNYFVQKDDMTSAKTFFTKLLEIDPENKNAKTALGRK